MNLKDAKGKQGKKRPYSVTSRGRQLLREEIFLERLSEFERKAYEECLAMLQGISENGNLEEACDWLERFVLEREAPAPTKPSGEK